MIPPDITPLPNLCTWVNPDPARVQSDEQRILGVINSTLNRWQQPPLDRLTQLYAEVDEKFLMTFPELDHYPGRNASRYWGTWSSAAGKVPNWPTGRKKRVFVYLKPFIGLYDILLALRQFDQNTLIYVDGITSELRGEFECDTFKFETEPLDLTQVAKQCDLAVLNGGHASTCTMLLAGRPTLQLPFFLEQMLMADAVSRYGLGLGVDPMHGQRVLKALGKLLSDPAYAESAKKFAANG